jgi:hypothetical protein
MAVKKQTRMATRMAKQQTRMAMRMAVRRGKRTREGTIAAHTTGKVTNARSTVTAAVACT